MRDTLPIPTPTTLPRIHRALIRPTPLVPVRLANQPDGPAIWCKLDFQNPSGSTKDRIAAYILGKALERGDLQPDQLIVEASSGSTSIAMAMVAAHLSLRFAAVMPAGVSDERIKIIKAYGGAVIQTDPAKGMAGAIEHARRLARQQNAFFPSQFDNPDNVEAHRLGTADEISRDLAALPTPRHVDAVVSGVGTGGTLMGLCAGLRERHHVATPVVAYPIRHQAAVEKRKGCFLDAECCSFSPRIPGVVDRLSKIYDPAKLPDRIELEIDDDEAIQTTRQLIRAGFPVGPSSGLNYAAALQAAQKLPPAATIVTLFPDRMERYFSTELFAGA
jgi:cysteine synthase A